MVASKTGGQIYNRSQSAVIFRATLVHQDGNITSVTRSKAMTLQINGVKLAIGFHLFGIIQRLIVINWQKLQIWCHLHTLKFILTTYIQIQAGIWSISFDLSSSPHPSRWQWTGYLENERRMVGWMDLYFFCLFLIVQQYDVNRKEGKRVWEDTASWEVPKSGLLHFICITDLPAQPVR